MKRRGNGDLQFLSSRWKTAIVLPTPSPMNVQEETDLFQHRYYNINRIISKLTGQWPYQSTRRRYIHVAGILLIAASQMIPQTIAIVNHRNDWNFLIDCIQVLVFDAFCLIKMFFAALNSKKMLRLLNSMRENWDVWESDRDVDIIHEYAKKGRNMTVVYAVVNYTNCVLFVIQPVIPKIVDILLRNGTKPGEFPVPAEYLQLDMQKYYFYIIFHNYVAASVAFIFAIAYDSLFMVCIQHGCGLYAMLGKKLERIGINEKSAKSEGIAHSSKQQNMSSKQLASFIERHKEAIGYSMLIEANYTWYFCSIAGVNMFLIIVTGLQLLKTSMDSVGKVKSIVGSITAIVHFFIECYMAQILVDHSDSIRFYILNSEWYTLPVRAQKLLLLMITRCTVPFYLTAGKMFTMSIESFTLFLKTTHSYFMLLRSL